MKLVVRGLNGDHLFSGSSLLSTEDDTPAERTARCDDDRLSAPPASGVFPVGAFAAMADDAEDAEPAPRPSGVFPQGTAGELETADDECALNVIDTEWGRLCARPMLRRARERPRLRIAG